MNDPKSPGSRLLRVSILSAFSLVVLFAVLESRLRAAWSSAIPSPAQSLVALNMKFEGSSKCGGDSCHGAAAPSADATARHGDEFTVWSTKDKHHTAFATLTDDPLSATIAQKLGIPSAAAADECLSCHSLSVPKPQQSETYDVKDGVTCNACHGPSGGSLAAGAAPNNWGDLHKQAGWIDTQRGAFPDHDKLLTAFGIYDTKPVLPRAERCASCHLAMDSKLVDAGHPQPVFELAYFSEVEPKHWREPADSATSIFSAKIWATGQAVCLHDALLQVADRVTNKVDTKTAVDQMHGHYLMFKEAAAVVDAAAATKLDGEITAEIAAPDAKASDIAAEVMELAGKISSHEFTTADVKTILGKVLATDEPTKIGPAAQLQQAEGIYELFNGYAAGAAPAGADDATTAAGNLPPPQTSKPSGPLVDFDKNLADARTKIGAVLSK